MNEHPIFRDLVAKSDGERTWLSALPPEKWHQVPAAVVRTDVLAWLSGREPLNHGALAHQIDGLMGRVWRTKWPFARTADNLVQRM